MRRDRLLVKTDPPTLQQTALLVSIASILQIAESFFPHPVPGIRLGLANMITLIALVRLGPACALETAVLRTLISSFALGTFLSPGFIMSVLAALGSTAMMILSHALLQRGGSRLFSLVGISLAGAASHNLIQLGVAYLLIVRHASVFWLAPWLGISAVLTGWLTGWIAMRVCRNLEAPGVPAQFILPAAVAGNGLEARSPFVDIDSPVHRLQPAWKLAGLVCLAPLVLLTRSFWVIGLLAAAILAAGGIARLSPFRLLASLRKQLSLILIAFLMPALFDSAGHCLWAAGPIAVTREGLAQGTIFASRLVLLMLGAALLVRTTRPAELATGFAALLAPLDRFGFNSRRLSAVMGLALASMASVWADARALIARRRLGGGETRRLIPDLVNFIGAMYRQAEAKETPPGQTHPHPLPCEPPK